MRKLNDDWCYLIVRFHDGSFHCGVHFRAMALEKAIREHLFMVCLDRETITIVPAPIPEGVDDPDKKIIYLQKEPEL